MAVVQTFRIDLKTTGSDSRSADQRTSAAATVGQMQEASSHVEWWEKLTVGCQECIRGEIDPAYQACKKDCATMKGDPNDGGFDKCRQVCVVDAQAMSVSKLECPRCSHVCGYSTESDTKQHDRQMDDLQTKAHELEERMEKMQMFEDHKDQRYEAEQQKMQLRMKASEDKLQFLEQRVAEVAWQQSLESHSK